MTDAASAVFHLTQIICSSAGIPVRNRGDKLFFTMLLNAFPDLEVRIEELIAEGDGRRVANVGRDLTKVFMVLAPQASA
jgi:predicted ester cyclase